MHCPVVLQQSCSSLRHPGSLQHSGSWRAGRDGNRLPLSTSLGFRAHVVQDESVEQFGPGLQGSMKSQPLRHLRTSTQPSRREVLTKPFSDIEIHMHPKKCNIISVQLGGFSPPGHPQVTCTQIKTLSTPPTTVSLLLAVPPP